MIYEKYNTKTKGNLIKTEILKLPLEEQDLAIAQWSFSMLDDYRRLPEPTMPKQYADYMKLPTETRKKMNKNPQDFQDLWAHPEVKIFMEERARIININARNKAWLEWMKKILPDQELPIRMKLHQFEDVTPGMDQPNWSD